MRLKGWINRKRDHGQVVFLDLRDRSGIVQLVGGKELKPLRLQDVVEVWGIVQRRPENLVNPHLATGTIEIAVEKIDRLAAAASLPFDLGQEELKLELPTLFNFRPLTLRHPRVKAIFKVQEVLVQAFRRKLKELDFTEVQVPTLVPSATEGGAEVFPVTYYEHQVYLAQSPQLYKQILVSIFERVFTVAHAYRAEPSVTTRHLSEYVSLDCEMGFIDDWTDLLAVAEELIRALLKAVEENCTDELELYRVQLPRLGQKIPRLSFPQALEILSQRRGIDKSKALDLEPEDERELCRWSWEEKGSDFVFITHYPKAKRPFYTYLDPQNPELTLSFDLLGRGFEWITGGQRIHQYQELKKRIEEAGNKLEDFSLYLQAFKYGMPPEGGFALGLERATQGILQLSNIREASLFPRDMERVDIHLPSRKSN